MKFNASIKPDGSLKIKNRKLFDDHMKSLAGEKDRDVEVEVKRKRKYRSVFQNAYYFGVVLHMVCERLKELGHETDKDTAHEFLKSRFLFTELQDEKTGEIIKIPRKTSSLSTSEFMDYLEDVKRFAAEVLDIYIPEPNEQVSIFD